MIIMLFFLLKKSRGVYKTLHPLFIKKISYIDFIKTTSDRNPLLYFELRQLYMRKKVTESDYNRILAKYH